MRPLGEIARINGRPKVVSQLYIGSLDKVAAMAQGLLQDDLHLKVEQFGALWLARSHPETPVFLMTAMSHASAIPTL